MNTTGRIVLTLEASILAVALVAVGLWLVLDPTIVGGEETGSARLGVVTARHVEVAPGRKTGDRMQRRVRVTWQGDAARIGTRWFGAPGASGETIPIVSEFVRDALDAAWAPPAAVAVFEFPDAPGAIAALGPATAVGTALPDAPAGGADGLMAWLVAGFGLLGGAWATRRWLQHADARRRARAVPWEARWMSGQD